MHAHAAVLHVKGDDKSSIGSAARGVEDAAFNSVMGVAGVLVAGGECSSLATVVGLLNSDREERLSVTRAGAGAVSKG